MTPSWETLRNLYAHFHPALVHFPIGLVLSGAALEAWSAVARRGVASPTARVLLAFGFLGAVLSIGSGLALFHPADFREPTLAVAMMHRFLGLASGVGCLAAVLVGGIRVPRTRARLWTYRVLYWLTALLIGLAGHYGGWIVFGWGRVWTP